MLKFENALLEKGFRYIAGVDEVGRGSAAGPISAAAVILNPEKYSELKDVRDSKKLTAKRREKLFDLIIANSLSYGIAHISHKLIDLKGLSHANKMVLKKAIGYLDKQPDFVISDSYSLDDNNLPHLALTNGDNLSLTVASASIIAKVTRDRMMLKYHNRYPKWYFNENKGYLTVKHKEALKLLGTSPIHRLSFSGVLGTT